MPPSTHDVVLTGATADGTDAAQARAALGKLMRLPEDKLEALLARTPIAIKRGIDADTAMQYKARIERTGMLCSLSPPVAAASPNPGPEPAPPAAPPAPAQSTDIATSDVSAAASRNGPPNAVTARPNGLTGNVPVSDWPDLSADIVEAGKVPAGRGAGWLGGGFAVFMRSPMVWMGMTLIYGVAIILMSVIPVVGALAIYLLQPLLVGGVMLGCRALEDGEPMEIGHLFRGFDTGTRDLLMLGAVYLGLTIGAVVIAAIFLAFLGGLSLPIAEIFESVREDGDIDPVHAQAMLYVVPLASLVMLGGMTVPIMMLWFAPALVLLRSVSVMDSLKLSLLGCLKNWLPFLIYGLILLPLCFIATVPLMLGWVVLGPVMMASIYVSYQEIFPDAEAVNRFLAHS